MPAEISDFICFKVKVVFTRSSYNVSASCIIIYNQTLCSFQYILICVIRDLEGGNRGKFIGSNLVTLCYKQFEKFEL